MVILRTDKSCFSELEFVLHGRSIVVDEDGFDVEDKNED